MLLHYVKIDNIFYIIIPIMENFASNDADYPNPKWTYLTGDLNFIVCCDKNWGIAKDGEIPWSFKTDMNWFKTKTTNNICIMGSRTYMSLDNRYRPLPNRHNIVLTSTTDIMPESSISDLLQDTVDTKHYINTTAKSPENAIKIARLIQTHKNKDAKIFLIGGEILWKSFISYDIALGDLYLTKIDHDFKCDQRFPVDLLKLIEYDTTIVTDQDRNTKINYELNFTIVKITRSNKGYSLLPKIQPFE